MADTRGKDLHHQPHGPRDLAEACRSSLGAGEYGVLLAATGAFVVGYLGFQVAEEAMNKLMYKALSIALSLLASLLAGAIFKKLWKLTPGSEEVPEATDERRGWGEILLAAALQGLIFALIKAVFERATAEGVREVTGDWPGEEGEPSGAEG
jgi:Protein of unknown function (DUF4235)